MKTNREANRPPQPVEIDIERYAHLNEAVNRARQEHDALEAELADLYAQACTVRKDEDVVHLNANVRILNERVKHFMTEWSAHIAWEKTELFPYAAWYLETEPDLFALMELDYGLAERFIGSFFEHAGASGPADLPRGGEGAVFPAAASLCLLEKPAERGAGDYRHAGGSLECLQLLKAD
ncbi:hypothetical protein [Cohnella rhizosphaerae]|uniref:Hemerythrin-like domain-containing protein n=1 Tax=Cohnella rhizosphaerae TaxID=1457232 RepID=A0A9X4L1A2_9BACL|nr:hypothetical protein [Cohnella rhizosphaerae]MDG0814373.1 hypothetical protein [Cohnella rhizosphaerae]